MSRAVASVSKDCGTTLAAYSLTGKFAGSSETPTEHLVRRYSGQTWLKSHSTLFFRQGEYTDVRITRDYLVTAAVMNAGGSSELVSDYLLEYGTLVGSYATEFVRASSDGSDGPALAHEAGTVSMMFCNDKNRTGGAWSGLGVGAFGRTVTPILEPSTYALIATGLLTIGVVAKWRGEGGQRDCPISPANARNHRYIVWRVAGLWTNAASGGGAARARLHQR